mmetsp:Transcript_11721/g.17189  ORF Transcript_11721/g.17189 Transcript_11721/m.17189 type:complete len:329 (-) Transcript_11721:119-1105(-)|eukprot:CAMPEP_0194212974 /NCGR_PEP_ID=MMETSP0156-20130528/13214_1 /TAXON_ID=33649 /ORGANISM="Thalassionema nitzschioides, Strain L26-B" /LENGTH=328 /DNA_ID=CAMNT_0038940901 /DNA_START=62 /DNA_END=1048 /DNA_ORIENTATION=+
MASDLVIAISSLIGVFITLMLTTFVRNHFKALRSSCIRRERGGSCCPVSCFGYIFDFRAFRENQSLPTVVQSRRRLDPEEEQLQAYYEAAALERRLRETANSSADGQTQAEDLRRARMRRTTLAIRTREIRLRRREERIAQRQQEEHERDSTAQLFCRSLSLEEKKGVLDAILSYTLYKPQRCHILAKEHSEEEEDSDQQSTMQLNSVATSSGSRNTPNVKIRNEENVTEAEKMSTHIEEDDDSCTLPSGCETSDSETSKEEDCEETCAFCLDEFVDGDVLAGRPERCQHTFHRSCLSSWLERKDFCPICRRSILTDKEWGDAHAALP